MKNMLLLFIGSMIFASQSNAANAIECRDAAGDVTVSVNAYDKAPAGSTHELIISRPGKSNIHGAVRQLNLGKDLAFFDRISYSGIIPLKLTLKNYSPNKTSFSVATLQLRTTEYVGSKPEEKIFDYQVSCSTSVKFSFSNYCAGKSKAQLNSLLVNASRDTDIDLAEQVISCGADINYQTKAGCSALISSIESPGAICRQNYNPADSLFWPRQQYLAERFLDLGAYYDVQDSAGRAAIHRAIGFWDNRFLELLIAYEADLNVQDSQGYSPLMLAAATGAQKAVVSLAKAGADVTLTSSQGKTAYDLGEYLPKAIRDLLTAVAKEVTIEGAGNKCSPLTIEIAKGERVRLILKAADSMYTLSVPGLNVNLMANAGEDAKQVIEATSVGTFAFECGVHGGAQSQGQIIVK